MNKPAKCFTWILVFLCTQAFAQIEQYDYKRELNGVSEQWHKLILPNDIFEETSKGLSDLRIFGITAANDTIEAPYLLRIAAESISSRAVSFNTLNESHNEMGYYFTFEIPTSDPINQIELEFEQQNFDWQLQLEGSLDQQEWFTVIDDYRILSIKNDITDFQFTKLTFPRSKYRFFRVRIDAKEKPELQAASITQTEIEDGLYSNHPINKKEIQENKQLKQTEIDINMPLNVPISYIEIDVVDTIDYYRPVTIRYASDSIKTEKGWKYTYKTLASGTLNSIEKNIFKIRSTKAKKLKILIHNQDNRSLTLGEIKIKGYVHELIARFTEPATYFLCYGNTGVSKPRYDIQQFAEKIPSTLTALNLGKEQLIEKPTLLQVEPLFKNKTWLWVVMIIIILLLGWFSIKMIRNS